MTSLPPIRTLILGGSGAYTFPVDRFGSGKETVRVQTPFGPAAPIRIVEIGGEPVGFLSRHGETGYNVTAPFVNYRANIYAAKELGVERILSWSGPGAIADALRPGDLVLPDDMIDLTRNRPSTFYTGKGIGFIRMNPVFCPGIHEAFRKGLAALHLAVHEGGTYVCTEGPRLETPAEIRWMKGAGGDLVGMTLAPEAFLARELEICYAPLCYVTNYAEGVRPLRYEKGVLFEGTLPEEERQKMESTFNRFPEIMIQTLSHLAQLDRDCPCKDAMLRYRLRGDIGKNWHDWIG
ncbi:MAG: MTAP family purine nucleoside phosphorylase [Deltaproteobacteria bacterium]|nr:MTAP family purine nucleoside phosphorylase [Deltaproteobacteria bacterium]